MHTKTTKLFFFNVNQQRTQNVNENCHTQSTQNVKWFKIFRTFLYTQNRNETIDSSLIKLAAFLFIFLFKKMRNKFTLWEHHTEPEP